MRLRTRIHPPPSFAEESSLIAQGYRFIAGIDEVGRGPLAGPVVAAAVILPPEGNCPCLAMVRDSKELTASRRELLFDRLRSEALAFGLGIVPSEAIDQRGILRATRLAMELAVANLSLPPDFLLIDAVRLPNLKLPQRSIIRGDQLSLSIASASILAKVTRDRLMCQLDSEYPGYGFAGHKGYSTPEHLESLRRLGACAIHRRSFLPVRRIVCGLPLDAPETT